MTNEALRPCPWCGAMPAVLGDREGWIVTCEDDDCPINPISDTTATEAETIAAWNQRAPDQPNSRVDQMVPTEGREEVEIEDRLAKADHSRTCYARALEKMRIMLVNVHDNLQDEGDRVYLGSSNDADMIREAWDLADALEWDRILAHTQPETPLAATNLHLQDEIGSLRNELAALKQEAAPDVVEAETVSKIAAMMSEFVDNWPPHKRLDTSLKLIAKTIRTLLDPPKHQFWGAGEPDCPREIKAGNGELHTLRCKVCGQDNPRDDRCLDRIAAALESGRE